MLLFLAFQAGVNLDNPLLVLCEKLSNDEYLYTDLGNKHFSKEIYSKVNSVRLNRLGLMEWEYLSLVRV